MINAATILLVFSQIGALATLKRLAAAAPLDDSALLLFLSLRFDIEVAQLEGSPQQYYHLKVWYNHNHVNEIEY